MENNSKILFSALANYLLGQKGVDVSPIINDLSLGADTETHQAIRIKVAAAYNGLKPTLPKEQRYEKRWGSYLRYTIYGASIIKDTYKVIRTEVEHSRSEQKWLEPTNLTKLEMKVSDWENLSTDLESIKTQIEETHK